MLRRKGSISVWLKKGKKILDIKLNQDKALETQLTCLCTYDGQMVQNQVRISNKSTTL